MVELLSQNYSSSHLLEMWLFKNFPQSNSLTSTSCCNNKFSSVVDKVTIGCFLDDHETAPVPIIKI